MSAAVAKINLMKLNRLKNRKIKQFHVLIKSLLVNSINRFYKQLILKFNRKKIAPLIPTFLAMTNCKKKIKKFYSLTNLKLKVVFRKTMILQILLMKELALKPKLKNKMLNVS